MLGALLAVLSAATFGFNNASVRRGVRPFVKWAGGQSPLLADLEQRGMLDETLIVWGGEFGRMPFSEGKGAPGRNHNPYGFSIWLAGGGFKPGIAFGDGPVERTARRLHVDCRLRWGCSPFGQSRTQRRARAKHRRVAPTR